MGFCCALRMGKGWPLPWDFHLPPFLSSRSPETPQGSACRNKLNISAADLWKDQEFLLGAELLLQQLAGPLQLWDSAESQHAAGVAVPKD